MASMAALTIFSHTPNPSTARTLFNSKTHFKRVVMVPVKCLSEPSPKTESEPETISPRSGSEYAWCAGLGALGFLETGYLTYLKLTNSDAFCPIGGGTCTDILNSSYAVVYGVPLPLIGMIAYGIVASLGLQLAGKNLLLGLSENNGRLILLGSTTSMAAASAYFMYLLTTKLAGASCSYCLISAILSFSLFVITVKDFELKEIQKEAGLLLCIAGVVIASLSNSYSVSRPALTNLDEIDLEPFVTQITRRSSPLALSLANHLRSIGAKMYGAFWCSHCMEQKEMFGQEAAKILDYVECYPNGLKKGIPAAKECVDAGIDGFPTWVIKDQVLNGEQELTELARVSGFVLEDFHPT
eukprot:TRINITY_DN427_c0_g1_i1.p1 TRINITY_DN427_c0_g1~~TRINITY_DN427_c0_g1_i1.p1  ORF type:complete len:355 (-),score=47.14 TRINITY_DN427_c0_g1_i1:552-1616(-)